MTLIPLQRTHLSLPRGEAVCGSLASAEPDSTLTAELAEASCPTCRRLHDRLLAPSA